MNDVAPSRGNGDFRIGHFRLLASAVAGRPLEVAEAGVGEPAWTDGVTVFVPPSADKANHVACLTVQSALVGAGSLDAAVIGVLARRPGLARRYLSVEGQRALRLHEHLLPLSVRRLIDPALAECSASPATSLAVARSGDVLPEPPPQFGVIRAGRVIVAVASDALGKASDAFTRHEPRRSDASDLRELDDDDRADAVDFLSSPVGGGGGIGRLLKKLFGDARSPGGGPPGADSPTHTTSRFRRTGSVSAVFTTPTPPGRLGPALADAGSTYPEWDFHQLRYRTDWCTVREAAQSELEQEPFAVGDHNGVRRALARLGVELQRHHRQFQGDDLDIDAAVEWLVESQAGCAPGEAVYIDSLRRQRDLSVLVLLDVSGSAGDPSATGVAVHEYQRAAAGLLTSALHELGDRVALYGFRSQGRRAVHVLPVKAFGDSLDAAAIGRLGGLRPAAYTRLGAAIRHSRTVLDGQAGTSRRLLVVLSDGLAYDHGYERPYGEADARRALAEARRGGIGCLCLSVGAATDVEALRRVFGTAAFASVPRVEQLPFVLGPLFRAALRSAEVQRRVFLRRERAKERLDVERRSA